ncbi:MAG: AsmA family protein, partial [Planctomycetes bacterium]|nr:AsmA family protein [Planctomycetota bacterium]
EADLRVTGTGSAGGAVDLRAEGGGGLAAILDLAARAGLGEPAPDAQGRAALRLRASAADGKAPLQVASEISLAGLSWPAPGGGAPWRQEKVTAALDGSFDRSEETALFEARIASDGGAVAARGSAVLASGRRSLDAAADLDIDLGSLTRARPDLLPLDPMEIGRAKGKVALKGALPEPLSLRGLAGTAFLALDSVRTEAFELRDASVDAILQGGVLRARSVDGTVNGGKVAASGILSLDAEPGDHVLDLRAEGVQVDRAMAWLLKQVVPLFAVAETGTVAGRLKLDLHLEGRGADWKAVEPTLKGRGTLEMSEGGISGSGILVDLLEMLGGAKSMEFRTVATEFTVADRKVRNERLSIGGKEHDMVLRGTTSFDGKLDYDVGAKFLRMKEKRKQRLQALFDEEGNLPFGLGGTLSKPKVKPPDLKKILGKVAEDEILKKLKELLGGDD